MENSSEEWQLPPHWKTRLMAVLVALLVLCPVVGGGYWVYQSRVNNAIVQPQQRQNLNQNANNRINVERQFRDAYAKYQSELQAVQLDAQNLQEFVTANGKPTGYPPYSQVSNEYGQLYQALTQDRQGLVNAVNDYNALSSNADTGQFRPADLPATLAVPTPTTNQ